MDSNFHVLQLISKQGIYTYMYMYVFIHTHTQMVVMCYGEKDSKEGNYRV